VITPQFQLPLHGELVIDLFAGGGGASTGIELAIGRAVDIAINHDPEAVSLHQANHPQTMHYVSDVFEVDPRLVTNGQRIGLLWASPDCTYHSKARGGKPFRDRNKAPSWPGYRGHDVGAPVEANRQAPALDRDGKRRRVSALGAFAGRRHALS